LFEPDDMTTRPKQGAAANAGWRWQFRCAVHLHWSGVAELGSFAAT